MKRVITKILILSVLALVVVACGAKEPMAPAKAMTPKETVKANMAAAKKTTKQLSIDELKKWKADGKKVMIIDARTRKEYAAGYVPGATNIPRGLFEFLVPNAVADTATPIVVYCKVGGRGLLATKTLTDIGYTNVYNLSGGYKAWADAGNPVDKK